MVMEKGSHSVLNLRPSAIEALIQNGVVPIVLLVTAAGPQQIRSALELYERSPSCKSRSKEASRRLWLEIVHLRQTISHLISDTVPLLGGITQDRFDEVEWMQNICSVIRYHQTQPVSNFKSQPSAEQIWFVKCLDNHSCFSK